MKICGMLVGFPSGQRRRDGTALRFLGLKRRARQPPDDRRGVPSANCLECGDRLFEATGRFRLSQNHPM